MRKDNETIFRRWIQEVWNKGDEKIIDEMLSANAVASYQHHFEKKPLYGIEEYKEFVRCVRDFFTDISIEIEQITADDKKVVAFCVFRGNRKPHRDDEDNPVAGGPFAVSGLCQIVIEDEKIVQTWSNLNLFG